MNEISGWKWILPRSQTFHDLGLYKYKCSRILAWSTEAAATHTISLSLLILSLKKSNQLDPSKTPKEKWSDRSGPLSSCVATAVGSSHAIRTASSVITAAKPVSSPSTPPFPFPVSNRYLHLSVTTPDLISSKFVDGILFAELLVKMGEMTGSSVNLRCQLPTEDLDALVSITSDEDLANLIEEYDHAAAAAPSSIKIRAFLSAPKTVKKVSPPPSSASFWSNAAGGGVPPRCPTSASLRCVRRVTKAAYPSFCGKGAGRIPNQLVYQYQSGHRNGCLVHLVHNGNHWQ